MLHSPPPRHTEAAGRDREDEEESTQRRPEETPGTRLATVTITAGAVNDLSVKLYNHGEGPY